jgi:mannose-6-phosphate isomerase-like protein (cupin superfamily)
MAGGSVVRRVDKPWGYELIWAITDAYVGKILHIERGHKLSLQYHRTKVETFLLYTGAMLLVVEDDQGALRETVLGPGDTHHVPAGRKHRMIALEDCEVFEVSTPELDDVVRVEDSYGRAGP